MIEIFTSYNNLLLEIQWLEDQIELCKEEREQWWIGGRLFKRVPMDNAAERYDRLTEQIEKMEKLLDIKSRFKTKIHGYISKFEGVENQIAYKKYVEGKTLQTIADELCYSYDRIRHIHSKMQKHSTFIAQTPLKKRDTMIV